MKQIIQQLFAKDNLHDIQVKQVEELAGEFPFYAAGQYLLAKKLQETADTGFERQFQKTLLYFHNPLWLEYQLASRNAEPELQAPQPFLTNETIADDTAYTVGPDLMDELVNHEEHITGTPEEMIEMELAVAGSTLATGSFDDSSGVAVEPATGNGIIKVNGENQSENLPETPGDRQTVQREEPFTFQAYHTVDYFASQGIKLAAEAFTGDKLGKQLKSFTEWLKTMRRLPEPTVEEAMEKVNDTEIVKHAAHSLEEKEVVTEAMAEVLSKQGKNDKAVEVYRKLSLINPQKSDYFAARIAEFKHS